MLYCLHPLMLSSHFLLFSPCVHHCRGFCQWVSVMMYTVGRRAVRLSTSLLFTQRCVAGLSLKLNNPGTSSCISYDLIHGYVTTISRLNTSSETLFLALIMNTAALLTNHLLYWDQAYTLSQKVEALSASDLSQYV